MRFLHKVEITKLKSFFVEIISAIKFIKMRSKSIISKEYINKNELVSKAKKIAEELKFDVGTEDLYSELDDLNFSIDIDEETAYFITFWAIKESEFIEDKLIIDGNDYYISIIINHDSEALPYLNKFLAQLLTVYPEMLVGDELHTDFYSIKQIEEKVDLPEWLLL